MDGTMVKRKGPQKHSTATIQKAIGQYENGTRLSAIAKEFGVQKSTVKYWLDNAFKFVAEGTGDDPVVTRVKKRFSGEIWEIIFSALAAVKEKLPQASVRDLILVISELFDRRAQFGVDPSRDPVPPKVLEKSEEVRITVQKYMQKRGTVTAPEPVESSLAVAPLEPLQSETTGAEAGARQVADEEGNGAT